MKSSFVGVGSLKEAEELFLADLTAQKYSPKSVSSYKYAIRNFISFSAEKKVTAAREVTEKHLEAYRLFMVESEYAKYTIELYIRAARLLFRFAEESGLIFMNPAGNLKMPKVPKKLHQIATVEEITRFIEAVDTSDPPGVRDRTIIEVAYSAALRLNELLSLKLDNLDLRNSSLRIVGKGNKERILPLTDEAVKWLRKYIQSARKKLIGIEELPLKKEDENCLWINNKGSRLRDYTLQCILHETSAAAGLDYLIRTHDLRRACATHMLQNGAHPYQIQTLLGHSDVKHLSQYLKLSITDIKEAHKNSKLGE